MAKPTRLASRRVSIDVPDGYVLSISLVPQDGGPVMPVSLEEGS